MLYLCVDKDGTEKIFSANKSPVKNKILKIWTESTFPTIHDINCQIIELPQGTIEKILGKKLTWTNWPVKFEKIDN